MKFDAIVSAIRDARKQSREARKHQRESLADLVGAKELDTAKLSSVLEGRHAAMAKSRPQILAKLADFHRSLNDDQRQKLAEKLKKMGRRHSKGE